MDPGFLLDRGHGGARMQMKWVEGPATPAFWPGRVTVRGRGQMPVTTYRCNRCGFLESYAMPEPDR
jgi:hypothetical protein